MTSPRARSLYAFLAAVGIVSGYFLAAYFALAFNDWTDSYRKWPWRAGITHNLTTLEFQESHSQLAALDANLSYAPVHSMAPGTVYSFSYIFCLGNTLIIHDNDGTYISYAHLNTAYSTAPGTAKVQGQLVAQSGNTGAGDGGTPQHPGICSSGPHLHFQRDSGPASGTPIRLEPISGVGSFALQAYKSDNAGIGDGCSSTNQGTGWTCTESSSLVGTHYSTFVSAYNGQGEYNGPGITWDACGGGNAGCWWVHDWTSGYTGRIGATQDFKGPPLQGAGAVMRRQQAPFSWAPNAYWVHGNIWVKYVPLGGPTWANLGYPISNEIGGTNPRSGTPYRWTWFEGGMIIFHAVIGDQTYESHGSIWQDYYNSGGPGGSPCGLPTSDVYLSGGWPKQNFQYGYIQQLSPGIVRYCP